MKYSWIGVTRFQMQITGPNRSAFQSASRRRLDDAGRAAAVAGVKARLSEILEQKGLGNVTFEVPIVADIPLNERTRKFQLIVNSARGADLKPELSCGVSGCGALNNLVLSS